VFERVVAGECAAGIVPVENSLAGSVIENWDLMLDHDDIHVIGELRLPVRHCLLALPGVRLEDVRSAHSHPQALAQSKRFLREHGIAARAAHNTAVAAREVAERGIPAEAAVASSRAGELYGLDVVATDIQERDDNNTRFFVIARDGASGVGDHASIAFTAANEPGALHAALGCFAQARVNLLRLESRPTRGTPWEYWFFVDLVREDGSLIDAGFLDGLVDTLGAVTDAVRVLGVYESASG
jgi:prephenate dehydratase